MGAQQTAHSTTQADVAGRSQGLIFAHAAEARVAASVTLAGMVAVLIGGAFMVVGPQLPEAPPRKALAGAEAKPVRMVGTPTPTPAQATDATPCAQQVWPTIERRCLVRVEATDRPAEGSAAKRMAKADPDDGKLTPLTATGDMVVGRTGPANANDNAAPAEPTAQIPAPQAETGGDRVPAYETVSLPEEGVALPPRRPPPREATRQRRPHSLPFHVQIGPFRF